MSDTANSGLFMRAFSALVGARGGPSRAAVLLKSGSRLVPVHPSDLLYIQAAANYAAVTSRSGKVKVRGSLKALQDRFEGAGMSLLRIHRSYLVAPHAVLTATPTRAGDLRLLMSDGTILLASRRYKKYYEAVINSS